MQTYPAYLAAIGGRVEVLQVLHLRAAKLGPDAYGNTLAHFAARHDYPQVIDELAIQAADMGPLNSQGMTAADTAAYEGNVYVLYKLAQHKALFGTPAFFAAMRGNIKVIQALAQLEAFPGQLLYRDTRLSIKFLTNVRSKTIRVIRHKTL